VHTRWSDGVATVAEVFEAASRLGLEEVGISDHFVVYPDGSDIEWSMPTGRLNEYVDEVLAADRGSGPTRIRLGLEVDYLPDTIEATRNLLRPYPFDYLIGSVHFIDGFPIDDHRKHWDALTPEQATDTWRAYYARLREMAESGVFDFVGHFDLPKKFGHKPGADLTAEVEAALDAIASADMAMEINTSGWSLPAAEAYPAPWILRAARSREIPVLVTADAHTPKYLVRGFDLAHRLAADTGHGSLARYARRRRRAVPL
jgi:histidinol-phosphatase (PHP family)